MKKDNTINLRNMFGGPFLFFGDHTRIHSFSLSREVKGVHLVKGGEGVVLKKINVMEQTCLNEFLAFVKGTKKEVNKEIISVANHGSAALGEGEGE